LVLQHRRDETLDAPGGNILTLHTTLDEFGETAAATPGFPEHFSGVFHLAAAIPKAAGEGNVREVLETNVMGCHGFLQAISGAAERFVFASTVDVYGGNTPEVITEETQLRPQDLYAASKMMGEVMVRRWGEGCGARTAIVRIGHIYGPGEGAYRKVIPNTIRRVVGGAHPALVGSGEELRDFLYVADAADGLVRAWDAMEAGDVGPVNLVSGGSVTVLDILRIICEASGVAFRYERLEAARPGRSFRFDASRAQKELGFRPSTPLEQGIRAEVEWFRSRGHRDG
jgi:UDP-glucose 4-epimerase